MNPHQREKKEVEGTIAYKSQARNQLKCLKRERKIGTSIEWNTIQPSKKRMPVICDNISDPGGHYAKRTMSSTERQCCKNLCTCGAQYTEFKTRIAKIIRGTRKRRSQVKRVQGFNWTGWTYSKEYTMPGIVTGGGNMMV